MKKKLIATLIAGAVLSTGIIGLTACGGNGINKGEQVDEAGWKTAITATLGAKNFTEESHYENTLKFGGKYNNEDINFTYKYTADGKTYNDIDNNSLYGYVDYKASTNGTVPDDAKEYYKELEFKAESYIVKDGNTIYEAYYYGESSDAEWNVEIAPTVSATGEGISYINGQYSTEKNGTLTALSALYDAFTYSNGVYTATLYDYSNEINLSIAIKGGYVVGVSVEESYEGEQGDMTMTETEKGVYNYSNYGDTTVSASDDAKKAVTDYKAN